MSTDEPEPIDGDGKIDPSLFPVPKTMTHVLEMRAAKLRTGGVNMAETGEDITSTWGGLSACYTAPEAEDLYVALNPVASKGIVIEMATDRVAGALEEFAETVRDIQRRWRDLKSRAQTFLDSIADDEDWDKGDGWFGTGDSANVEKNDELLLEAAGLVEEFKQAEVDCANKINIGLDGRTEFIGADQVGGSGPDADQFVHGVGVDVVEIPEAWGEAAASTDYGWVRDVGDAVWDYGVEAVEGVGAMVGAHSSEGWFQASWGDALKEYHWDNLTSAASLVGLYDAESDSFGPAGWDAVGQAWKDLAHSVVPWEEWDDRPGYVIGTAALNVVGLVGGAVLTATGVGAVVGVPLMAWRGMAVLDGMGGSGRGGGSGADLDLPQMPDLPRFGGAGSPTIDLTGQTFDVGGFDSARLADMQASIDRLASPTPEGTDSGGGRPARPGRPGPEPSHADGRVVQRPGQGAQDPTVADALAFDDIVGHPDNAAFSDQVRGANQGAINDVDQAAKTGSDRSPASDEGTWAAQALFEGPESAGDRQPAMAGGGRPSDTLGASAARNVPGSSPVHARADGIDAPGNDRSFGNEVADNRSDRGTQMGDRTPTATNQDGNGPSPNAAKVRVFVQFRALACCGVW